MTRNKREEEDNGGSLCLSSQQLKRPQDASGARRKMWGEDGNGARRI
jgi:hypothetical protein